MIEPNIKHAALNLPKYTYDGRRDGPVHEFFELTYASYLVLPRSVLQCMPIDWQERLVKCLREMEAATEQLPDFHGARYTVSRKDARNRFCKDPYSQYRRPVVKIPDL